MVCFVFLSMIGVAVIGGDVRFTGGFPELLGGIDIVAALIGLYCIPVLIGMVAGAGTASGTGPRARFSSFRGPRHCRPRLDKSSALINHRYAGRHSAGGRRVDCILIAYAEARRASPRSENFGKGEPSGILATESANNATVGGGLIPTLVLGIPERHPTPSSSARCWCRAYAPGRPCSRSRGRSSTPSSGG